MVDARLEMVVVTGEAFYWELIPQSSDLWEEASPLGPYILPVEHKGNEGGLLQCMWQGGS